MWKTILKVVGIIALFLVLLIVGATFFLNNNQYKSALQESALTTLGYELIIAGDLDINFFPSLALTLNDVRLKNPAFPQELASISAVSLRVDTRKLFRGQLLIQELSADDFHINYYTDANGNNIWDVEPTLVNDIDDEQGTASIIEDVVDSAVAQQANNNNEIVTPSFQRIRIFNASIDIQDLSTGTRLSIRNLDLDSRDTNIEGRPFDLNLTFDYLNNGMTKPMAMGFRSNIVADINGGTVSISDINFNLTPMLLQGEVQLTDLDNEPRIDGALQSNEFDLVGLLETLGVIAASEEFTTAGTAAKPPQVAIALNFSGDQNQLTIPSFTATMGVSELQADASVHFATAFTPTNISYDIILNSIDLTPFMASTETDLPQIDTEGTSEAAPPAFASTADTDRSLDTPLPLDVLTGVNVLGAISIQAITTDSLEFRDINIFTNLEGGQLDIETQAISIFGGAVQGNLRLHVAGTAAELSTELVISEIDIVELVPMVAQLDSVTGKLNMEVNYSASGSTVNEMLASLSGSTSFTVTENSVDIGLIKQVFTAITALSPGGDTVQQWPDVIQFSELGGLVIFEGGIAANQQLKLRMDNFDISGTGGINLAEKNFDYDMQFTVLGEPAPQTIQINERYHNVQWPVSCAASMSDPVSQYCGPDFTRVREIFTQMATNELRNRAVDSLINQVPQQLQDSARGLLRSILN